MSTTIRFHLDEHVHPGVAVGLRAHGIDVTTTAEAGLVASEDTAHLAFALRAGRVIVTHDEDYLRHHALGVEHAGIAYCHQRKHSVGGLLQMLLLLRECYTLEEMKSRVEFL